MEKTEKSIRRIGIYFLVLGVISALYGIAFQTGIVIPICIILMCIPRLVYNKKWAGVSLMISSILMTVELLPVLSPLQVAFQNKRNRIKKNPRLTAHR